MPATRVSFINEYAYMAKAKPLFTIESFGIYNGWQDNGKSLPKIETSTTLITASVGVEFGLIVRVLKGKGLTINWCIEHPDVYDENGAVMPAFVGNEKIRNNDWQFYLGDTIWLPEHDKVGIWRMFLSCNNSVVADKSFELTLDCLEAQATGRFWKRRGF